ncbi:MAG TPA: DUF3604 domain-containing protein [Candidatus Binatia bacterium]
MLLAALGIALLAGCSGESTNEIVGARRPQHALRAQAAAQKAAQQAVLPEGDARRERRILFGDLHVHTTYSIDAFMYSLPLFGGEGAHPPADACDFARYCAAVDFFALTEHAEGLTPEQWTEIKQTMRECNARAGDPRDPDMVAFVGWEWTQVGPTPETHFGHKNVIFPGLADDELPARVITSLDDRTMQQAPGEWGLRAMRIAAALTPGRYGEFVEWMRQIAALPTCEAGVDTRTLPASCRENAPTPRELFEKLAQWGFDVLVIPHGLTWGLHTPAGARLDVQLKPGLHDPERQTLLEVFSGHGNGEPYRAWPEPRVGEDGEVVCPPPTEDYLPCCWRAGEIIRERCGDLPTDECERRVEEARRLAASALVSPHLVIPDTREEDWLDCDQCRDCFKPAFTLRPKQSAQYSLALSRPGEGGHGDEARDGDDDSEPLRFRWGFVASSDDHHARPGTGYKQVGRRWMTDTHGFSSEWYEWALREWAMGEQVDPQRAQPVTRTERSFATLFDVERVSSFMYPGGLVAVHADGRDRDSIWRALKRREVYGTSGPRILLWFDLVNAPGGPAPMGSEVRMSEAPRFEVRAVGSLVQKPGCPPESVSGLPAERLEKLCHGECYNPGDERVPIAAIEIVRVRPQTTPDEDVATLIDDPWRRFECPPDPAGCVATFEDPEFASSGRDAVYYARAIQQETPAINGANLRTRFDAEDNAVAVEPCHGSYRARPNDDCLAPVAERAWSSPIFVDQAR